MNERRSKQPQDEIRKRESDSFFYEIVERSEKSDPFVVDFRDSSVGGKELLPKEVDFDFSCIKSVIIKIQNEYKGFNSSLVFMILIKSIKSNMKPLVLEVGRDGFSGLSHSPFEMDRSPFREKINHVSAGIINPLTTNAPSIYARVPVEQLSTLFNDGHRANIIYLGDVLTDDGVAADVSTSEKRLHVLDELDKSLMPGGIIMVENFMTTDFNFKDDEFEKFNFEIIKVERIGKYLILIKK